MFDLVIEFLRIAESTAFHFDDNTTRVEYLLSNRALKLTFRQHLTLE